MMPDTMRFILSSNTTYRMKNMKCRYARISPAGIGLNSSTKPRPTEWFAKWIGNSLFHRFSCQGSSIRGFS